MRKYRKFSGEQKARIVLAVLKDSNKMVEICKEHSIKSTLVNKWKDQFESKMGQVFENEENKETDRKLRHYEHVITKITTQNDFLEKVLVVVR